MVFRRWKIPKLDDFEKGVPLFWTIFQETLIWGSSRGEFLGEFCGSFLGDSMGYDVFFFFLMVIGFCAVYISMYKILKNSSYGKF